MSQPSRDRRPYVLVVDDTPSIVHLISRVLTRCGFEVEGASSGAEALARIQDRRPDLILLDVVMPGLSGFDVCARLKESRWTAPIPVIFLTGKTETEDVVKGFQVGGVDYVTKPFQTEELVARVNTHVQLYHLRAILPICSYCSRIRNDEGEWERLEAYIHRQMGANFSHGICPVCYEQVKGKSHT
ncbi:MAG: response regulator [Lentisphaeria bacterium]|nr:response regulator [Lentisphaeria bacterium]